MTRLRMQIADEHADPEEVASLTSRLQRELLDLDVVAAEPVSVGETPPGARAVDMEALGALLVTVAKSGMLVAVVNAVTAWLAGRRQRSVKLEVDGDVLELTGVPSSEQRRLTEAWLGRHATVQRPAQGSRSALIVASYDYQDPGLRRLRSPARDAEALARVLRDAQIGGFDVRVMLNEPAHVVNLAVEEFFADRDPDDLLLVHFSGHGVKGEDGDLYFATADTRLLRLAATAVAADFVNRRMGRTRSRRVVLLLDCCYAGAFERGMTARAGTGVDIEEQLGGRGRAVITASSAMEYAFEGEQLVDAHETQPSVFSSALVEGLASGDADRDQDGLIALDELYDYVYDKVRATTPNQTPSKWTFGVQGELYIARRSRPVTRAAPLPAELRDALESSLVGIRLGAIHELEQMLHGRHAGQSLAASKALERLTEDDSRSVAAAATTALGTGTRPASAAASAAAPPPPPAAALGPVLGRAAPAFEPVASPARAGAAGSSAGAIPDGAGPGADLSRLPIAGGLALLSAVLLAGGLFLAYDWGEWLVTDGYGPGYPLVMALVAAGAGVRSVIPGGNPLIGAGALLGAASAAVWGLGFLGADLAVRSGLGAGFWFEFVAHLLLLFAAGLATAALFRAGRVRLARQPNAPFTWLVALLGVVGAVALLLHNRRLEYAGFSWSGFDYDSLVPSACLGVTGLVLPAFVALAAPHRYATAVLAGWAGGGAAVLANIYFHPSEQIAADHAPLIAFGCTLLALVSVAVWQGRSTSAPTGRP